MDGDTFVVSIDGSEERVRLIGIDAPESGECLGAEATAFLDRQLRSGSLRLEQDETDRDPFGRLLRRALAGDFDVSEALVEAGLAIARSYPPDTAWDAELAFAQQRARADGAGIWDPAACGEPRSDQLTVTAINENPEGDDTLNLLEEWVEVTNVTDGPLELTGWGVRDESASKRFYFPDGFVLDAGAAVRVRSGCGADTANDLHWCVSGSAVWNNDGDTVFVFDPDGSFAAVYTYP